MAEIVWAVVTAVCLSLIVRLCMISFRNNIVPNEEYQRYIKELEEGESDYKEEPEAYLFSDMDFVRDFRINGKNLRNAIFDGEFFIILFINLITLLVVFNRMQNSVTVIATILVLQSLIILSLVDLQYELMPDSAHIIILLASLLLFLASDHVSLNSRFIGMLIGGGFMWILYLLGGMGGGDVKLMAAAGFWLGTPYIIFGLMVGIFCAAFVGLFLIILKKKTRKDRIAFGPYLALGIMAATLFFEEVVSAIV